jgi:hypothetical protein
MLIAAVVVVTVLYVLSYAPYIRYRHGASGYPDFSGLPESALALYDFDADWSSGTHRGFAPVERLIDETPLAAPLTLWARVWGCDQTFPSFVETANGMQLCVESNETPKPGEAISKCGTIRCPDYRLRSKKFARSKRGWF